MYYVSMTDRFFSGWGKARNTINKFVVRCDTYGQAETVARNASMRSEMKYVNICTSDPTGRYERNGYVVSLRTYDELGEIWKG